MRDSLLPAGEGPRATLASTTGPAYLIRNQEQRLMKPGEQIGEKEWIRTASGSRAMVRLSDGSMVEMNERSELAVSRNRADTTVYLERGTSSWKPPSAARAISSCTRRTVMFT